jgi:predicted transcriptional regulator
MNLLYKYAAIKSAKPNEIGQLSDIIEKAPQGPVNPDTNGGIDTATPDSYLDATLGTLANDNTSRSVAQLAADINAMNDEDVVKFFGQPIDETLYSGLITSPEMRQEVNQRLNQITGVMESELSRPVKSLIKRRILAMLRLG